MQAILKLERAAGLDLGDVPVPTPGPRDVLVRVLKTGICGTDRHIYEWDAWASGRIKPPLVAGHEFVGIVEDTGVGVRWVQPGDRVSGEGHIGCGHCYACRTGQSHICDSVDILGVDVQGCFAPYVSLPESNIWKVDPAICDDQACLFDPFGNAMHTVMAQPISGKQVLVLGCGPIGLAVVVGLSTLGVEQVFAIDKVAWKLDLAGQLGATTFLAGEDDILAAVREATQGRGVDWVVEACGVSETVALSLELARVGGHATWIGNAEPTVSISLHAVVQAEKTVMGSYGYTDADFRRGLDLVAAGLVPADWIADRPITFDTAPADFEALATGRWRCIKAVVVP